MDNRIIIIDGNSLINRAYYAVQNPMTTRDGVYTQGIYGFLTMLEKLGKDYPAGYIAVAFDLKAPTFRHKEYDQYKAGRKKMPPELAMQIPLLKDVLDAMNIRRLSLEGFEADDVIGPVAREAEEAGLIPLIVTGDKDQLQLATETTHIMLTKRGVSQFKMYDAQAMIDEYGFTAAQFIDYKGLMGDPSDNIPGLPGVGPKTAQRLILDYGSVEGVLAHTDELKGKLRERVEENAQTALMSKRLATINTHVPLEYSLEDCRWEDPDYDRLVPLYQKLEFNRFLKQLTRRGEASKTAGDEALVRRIEETPLHILRTKDDLLTLEKALAHAGASTTDQGEDAVVLKLFGNNDHRHRSQVRGAALLAGDDCCYVALGEGIAAEDLAALIDRLRPALCGHDLRRDCYMLMEAGAGDLVIGFDTAVAQYVLDPGKRDYDLPVLLQEKFHVLLQGEDDFEKEHAQADLLSDEAEAYADYGRRWCVLVRALAGIQRKEINEEELGSVLYDIEIPLVVVMASMEYEGFRLDREALCGIGESIAGAVEKLSERIYELAGEEFNIKSPKQLGPILFEKLGLPAGKKTKTGYSTSADILEKIADQHEIVPLILEYRQLTKLQGTYIDGLLPLVHEDGKIHAHFNQTVAATGRISSSEPNLQNIPVRQELGRSIRKAFVVDTDRQILLGADYSQIELRVLAHMSRDPQLIASFNRGEDIHRATAARVLGIPETEITPLQRSRAKAINFGVIYGMSAFGLSGSLHITRREAENYIREYFAKHEAVKSFMDGEVAFCREHGYVKTITGRRRMIPEIKARNFMTRQLGERLAMNSPIQGSAADIIKLAMISAYERLKPYRSKLILQVHDELILRVEKDEREAIQTILLESMEQAMELAVDLAVDVEEGENWYQLK